MQRFRLYEPQSLSRWSLDYKNIYQLPVIKHQIIQAILTTLSPLLCTHRTVSTFCMPFLLQIIAIYIYIYIYKGKYADVTTHC